MVSHPMERRINAHSVASVDRGRLLPMSSPGRPKSGDEGGRLVRMFLRVRVVKLEWPLSPKEVIYAGSIPAADTNIEWRTT